MQEIEKDLELCLCCIMSLKIEKKSDFLSDLQKIQESR